MSTRYLIAALLMTSACVAQADVLQSAPAQAKPRVAKMVTFMARPAAAELTAVTPSGADAAALTANASVMASTGASPVAAGQLAQAAAASVPEPSSIALMMAGMFGVMGLRRRRNR